MEDITWDIIGLYIICCIISLVIFYKIIKLAIKNAIKEIRDGDSKKQLYLQKY